MSAAPQGPTAASVGLTVPRPLAVLPSGSRVWMGDRWMVIEGAWERVLAEFVAGLRVACPQLMVRSWEVMRLLRNNLSQQFENFAADVVITDPPYGDATHRGVPRRSSRTARAAGGREVVGRGDEAWAVRSELSFPPVDAAAIAPHLVELSRRWVVAFCELEQLGDYRRGAGPAWVRGGVAMRRTPAPQLTGDRPAVPADGVAIMHRPGGRKRWNAGGQSASWSLATAGYTGDVSPRLHETPKPVGIMRQLVEAFSEPGELVVDPYAGSGTTLVAAVLSGRRALGVEVQPHYAELAAARLAEVEAKGMDVRGDTRQMSLMEALCTH